MTSPLYAVSGADPTPAASLVVPCPVLIGRSREADALAAALDAACDGRGRVVFVVGEAGIGKSRLVHEVSSMARERGVRVLRGRAVAASGATAFRPLTEALAPVLGEVDSSADLARWMPAFGAILPTVAPATGVDVTPPVRGEAVLRLLSAVCGHRGGLLVLEDLHWSDPETVAVVEHLSDNLVRAPVLCVVTVRSEDHTAARALAPIIRAPRPLEVMPTG